MAYDEAVARRVSRVLGKSGEIDEKMMFGGVLAAVILKKG